MIQKTFLCALLLFVGAAQASDLLKASRRGDLGRVKELVRAGAPINTYDDTMPPLVGAVAGAHVPAVNYLLKYGADANYGAKMGMLPLQQVCTYKDEDAAIKMAAKLLAFGADPNKKGLSGVFSFQAPLGLAAAYGKAQLTSFLLEHGADPNEGCQRLYTTPLMIAATANKPSVAQELINAGADLYKSKRTGSDSLILALKQKSNDVVALLCDADVPTSSPKHSFEDYLYKAVEFDNLEGFTQLLDVHPSFVEQTPFAQVLAHVLATDTLMQRAPSMYFIGCLFGYYSDINAPFAITPRDKQTALQYVAGRVGYVDVIPFLLRNGADQRISGGKKTALEKTVEGNSVRGTKLLLDDITEHGYDKHCMQGRSLHVAAQKGNEEIMNILLHFGFDAEKQDKNSETPLIIAARCGHLPIVKRLLACDVDTRVEDKQGKTAVEVAADKQHIEIVSAILEFQKTHQQ